MIENYLGSRQNCCEPLITSVFIKNADLLFSDPVVVNASSSDNGWLSFVGPSDFSPSLFFKGLGRMFYIIDPSETSYKNPQEVPSFFTNAWPYFLLFMLLENLVLWLEKKPTFRLNDGLTSLSHGLIRETGRIIFRGGESYAYYLIYENLRLVDLPWDKPSTWYLAALGVDFCYYWVHRACHEVHILWAQHQVHHSSEEYNLAVGLRQSIMHGWCGFIFYLPLAFVIPPAHFITHQQFNLLYQFWIHTKAIKTLGPLELIFNTPQHHRVHHGSNIYCLDKNYGGVLIIWDRIFGTFAAEKKDEEIIYGLVFNQPSFNVLHLQTFYTRHVAQTFALMSQWRHKLAVVFYGPSWQPGKPRLGLEEDKFRVVPREKYDVKLPLWCNIYLLVHFCVVVYGFQELTTRCMVLSPLVVFIFGVYIIGSLTTIGMLFDNTWHAAIWELLRCMLAVTAIQRMDLTGDGKSLISGDSRGDLLASNSSQFSASGRDSLASDSPLVLACIEAFFVLSGLFWLLRSAQLVQILPNSRHKVATKSK